MKAVIIIFLISFTCKANLLKISKVDLKKFSKCKIELLNPNLGQDIYNVECNQDKDISLSQSNRDYVLFNLNQSINREINDPMYIDQWGHDYINLSKFWSTESVGNKRIKVAIIDSGINIYHEDLKDNLAINTNEIPENGIDDDGNGYVDDYYGWNSAENNSNVQDEFEHGSHISGIIGASSNNFIGIAGLNWHVSIIPIRFIDHNGGGSTESAIKAIDYAVSRGAQIINLSWGGRKSNPLLLEIMQRCEARGILFVAAAGNESNNNDINPTYPANSPINNIISVASINVHNELSSFSNFGKKSVHVAAPGESILSTIGGNRYGFKDGTSMATPYISGVASLIWSAHQDWNYLQVKDYILSHCQKIPSGNLPLICGGYFSF